MAVVAVEKRAGYSIWTLNRPGSYNAINDQVVVLHPLVIAGV